ncbi:hypothetical protein N7462_004781 [Penicillium macrosclerotiorum]|uniref:uncharacterized protein n=1 Tax=Penicillium macrosclerotiorum TaxID=303699 RepID=UPI0025468C37|nr:uncharacterized protein N7462_004781 [Penicillium macrosclerotiorum]KAJ5690389.1 hypothetical protein N7462_004781 [Penicillium macrosclerotiorum]
MTVYDLIIEDAQQHTQEYPGFHREALLLYSIASPEDTRRDVIEGLKPLSTLKLDDSWARATLALDRQDWNPGTPVGLILDPRGLSKAAKKEITDKFLTYREKPVFDNSKLQNCPPPNVTLTDEWVEIVCGQVPNRERGQRWALDLNTQGDISADRVPVEPAPLKRAHGLLSFLIYKSYFVLCGTELRRRLADALNRDYKEDPWFYVSISLKATSKLH